MSDSTPSPKAATWFQSHRCMLLLVALLAFLLIQPMALRLGREGVFGIFMSLVLIGGVQALCDCRRNTVIGLVLATPFFLGIWASIVAPGVVTSWIQVLTAMVFMGYTTYFLLRHVIFSGRVTADTLFGAACVYLLIGLVWTFTYMLVELIHPGSLMRGSGVADPLTNAEVNYFSFVTLTTLGYGDISPATPMTRALAVLEAVSGVLYLAFLVARLIGMHKFEGGDAAD